MMRNSVLGKKALLLLCSVLCGTASWGADNIKYPVLEKSENEIDVMIDNMQCHAAEEKITKLMTQAKRRRADTSQLERQLERCNKIEQGLRGTDRVVVVDSVVLDKKDFLKAYGLSDDLGTVTLYADGRTTEYMTQRGNVVFTVEEKEGRLQLFSAYVENGERNDKTQIEGLGVDGDLNYPYLLPDGSTLYFAARSEGGYGNYDLYVTRYDYEDKRYYRAESLGFPYNSYANDYMLVIDEDRQIGWFASDRYQPEGMVCIYTFIPNHSRHPYDFENEPYERIVTAAKLRPVSATWNEQNRVAREQAKKQLELAKTATGSVRSNYEFTLVIDDQKTYHYYREFRSAEAKTLCRQWQEKRKQLGTLNNKLETLRNQYRKGKNEQAKAQILQLEKQTEALTEEVSQTEKQARNAELQNKN